MSEEKEPDFETTLEALESVVEDLENGELTLAAQLEAFEKGISLADQCKKMLEEARLKVTRLSARDEDEDDSEF